MELPKEIIMIISEYSKPASRPDWRLGSYLNRTWFMVGGLYWANYSFSDTMKLIRQVNDWRYLANQVDLFELIL